MFSSRPRSWAEFRRIGWTARLLPLQLPLPMPTPASCASWSAPKETISVRRSICRRTSGPRSSRRLSITSTTMYAFVLPNAPSLLYLAPLNPAVILLMFSGGQAALCILHWRWGAFCLAGHLHAAKERWDEILSSFCGLCWHLIPTSIPCFLKFKPMLRLHCA